VTAASSYDLRVATADDLAAVLGILDEAAAWLWSRSIRQWPEYFEPQWLLLGAVIAVLTGAFPFFLQMLALQRLPPRIYGLLASGVPAVGAIMGFLVLGEALAASQRAVSLASQRYDRGLTDFLNVVDAERQQYELEQQYAVAQVTVGEQFVALYKGLGGGWEQYQSIPPIRQPQPAIVAAFRRLLKPDDPPK